MSEIVREVARMRLIDLDEFLLQNCIDRMEGKSCEECKYHVLEVSCERLMGHPTIDPVNLPSAKGTDVPDRKVGKWIVSDGCVCCSECGEPNMEWSYCPNCGARMGEVK